MSNIVERITKTFPLGARLMPGMGDGKDSMLATNAAISLRILCVALRIGRPQSVSDLF
ncbi:MAG TPA: hypothetical protein VNE86_02220 [Nitrososphaerales archaeon]|nr:hypothetical protein [Nitrososphaerales archaeon]